MKKFRLKNLIVFAFATFLILAVVEAFAVPTQRTEVSAAENSSLEVPLTGSPATKRTSETYETLIEIAFLALTGVGFYLLNTRRERRK